jgi:hypothetical protein
LVRYVPSSGLARSASRMWPMESIDSGIKRANVTF